MRYVFHVDDEPAHLTIDGRLITIPPNEIFEVKELRGNHFNNNGPCEYIITEAKMVEYILQQGWYHGIVEVPTIKTKGGVTTDIETAKQKAHDELIINQDKMLAKYVTEQQERTVLHGKAAIAPNGRIAKIIETRGIDIKKEFNLDPPGYKIERMNARDQEVAELKKQVAELMEALGSKQPKASK